MQTFIITIFIYLFISVIKADNSIILQSTTSLKNSGFYDYILPFIYKDLGIKVNVVAVGTGAAIRNSMNCDGDLLIVHSPQQEKFFMENGFSKKNHYIMHNYYVVIGPNVKIGKGIKGPRVNLDEFKKINLQNDILYEFNRMNI